MIDRVCKRCYLCSCKNRLFVFCLIYLSHIGRWNEASDVYQKSNWGGMGSFGLQKYFICGPGVDWEFLTLLPFPWWGFWDERWGSSRRETFKGHFWDSFPCPSFLPQSGTVQCRRMTCPPLSCSPDSLPVHIAGQCCKVCRRKYRLRVRVALCALRFVFSPYF